MRALTTKAVYEAPMRFCPAKNDEFECGYEEELQELKDFGITREAQLLALLKKRTDEVMNIDRSPMNESEIQMDSADEGEEFVANRLPAYPDVPWLDGCSTRPLASLVS